MKIGIDARPLQHETQYRGIGKALEFFLLALPDCLEPDDSLVFYLDSGLPRPKILDNFPKSRTVKIATTRLGRKRYFRSFLPSFRPLKPRAGDVDVILQYDASFGVPKNVPSVVTFLDLIPVLFRGQEKQRPVKGFRKGKDALARSLYWKKYLRVLELYKNASKIVAISASSRNDLLKHMTGINPDDVAVVHLGVNAAAQTGKPGAKIKNLAAQPYLLYVGGIDIRKNVVGLLETFYQLKPRHPRLRLIMVGKEFELKERLEDLGWFTVLDSQPAYAKDVIIPGFVSHDDLFYLYQHTEAFVFPSRYEGFGLPVLEAMSAGSPVIAYDNSSIPEVAGDAALLVEDGKSLAPAVEKLLGDPALHRRLVKKGHRQVSKFSWHKTVTDTLKIMRQLVDQ
ncbi:MAG TPA: glycosyltransferase family 1 protein [Candidatus Nitrosopolaris sp.]|nr:glycosyltransferase family 1 protein [Candidatus Nitrosopolaris sp.]